MAASHVARCLLIALVLTSAAVAVSAQDVAAASSEEYGYPSDDVDRTDFTEEHLREDKDVHATVSHSEIEVAWIFPESPDGKLPVDGTSDLLIALANAGSKMFNVSHFEGRLLDATGEKLVLQLPRIEFGQPLGPNEQRSFRVPIELDAEMTLGEHMLSSKIFYNTRDKEPFVSPATANELVELVPPLPKGDAQLRMLQMALGLAGVLVVGLLFLRSSIPSADGKGRGGKKPKAAAGSSRSPVENEWLQGTLAGTEGRSPKKTKRG